MCWQLCWQQVNSAAEVACGKISEALTSWRDDRNYEPEDVDDEGVAEEVRADIKKLTMPGVLSTCEVRLLTLLPGCLSASLQLQWV